MKVPRLKSVNYFTNGGFPLAIKRVNWHPVYSVLHRHEFHELVLITHGRGCHRSDTHAHPISTGDVFLLRGNMQHSYVEVDQLNLINILFEPQPLGLPLTELANLPGFQRLFHRTPHVRQQDWVRERLHLTPVQLAEAERLAALLEQELQQRTPGYQFTARAHLMYLLAHLSRCHAGVKRPTNEGFLRLGAVLSYLDHHYREPVTIAELLPVAHMSKSTLMRTCQRVLERSPIDYLIRVRIQKSLAMLADRELRISDIALACGFNDSNYFTRQFRRVMGCSPRAHRQAVHGKPA